MFRTILAALVMLFPVVAHSSETVGYGAEDDAVQLDPSTVVVAFDRDNITPLIAEGFRNFESLEPVQANDPVRIASISKLIMALATLRLVNEGKVDLDADVSEYLGWQLRSYEFPLTKVTLRQILSHRAGLSDGAGYIIPLGESLEEKLKDPDAWNDTAKPGEAPFEYANLGAPIVATALEGASGERYDLLLERLIFKPLGIKACINWIGCSEDMVSRAVTLYRHTNEPARDYPGDLPPDCSIPVAQGVECSLEDYVPGTNASVFSPQGGVRIGMLDLAKIGQELMRAPDGKAFSLRAMEELAVSLNPDNNPEQEFFCTYGLGIQWIEATKRTCLDNLFEDRKSYYGHSGEAYGLQSGLWFDALGEGGFVYFRTQVPPPVGGEDTGGFTQGERDLMKRARALLATKQTK